MVYYQNFSHRGEGVLPLTSLSVLTVENFHGGSQQDFKMYPLPLVNYKVSTSLPLSALLAIRDCARGNQETTFPIATGSHWSLSFSLSLVSTCVKNIITLPYKLLPSRMNKFNISYLSCPAFPPMLFSYSLYIRCLEIMIYD